MQSLHKIVCKNLQRGEKKETYQLVSKWQHDVRIDL